MSRPKCLRCGAGAEWIEGRVPNEPAAWRDASKEKPDDQMAVLIYAPDADEPVWIGWWDSECSVWREPSGQSAEVTHWMDLPEPPNEKGQR